MTIDTYKQTICIERERHTHTHTLTGAKAIESIVHISYLVEPLTVRVLLLLSNLEPAILQIRTCWTPTLTNLLVESGLNWARKIRLMLPAA